MDIIFAHMTGDDQGLAERSVRGWACTVRTEIVRQLGSPPWTTMISEGEEFKRRKNGKTYIQYGPECLVQSTLENAEMGYKSLISRRPAK